MTTEVKEKKAPAEKAAGKEIVSSAKLKEATVYWGSAKARWNPKMAPYIAGAQRRTHLIDIQKTKRALEFAYTIIKKFAERDATFIFVGTRKNAQATIKENALRTNSFYVSERWLGGTLTNNRTIFRSVKRMFDLERKAQTNFEGYTKKEGVLFAKDLAKLQKNLSGVKNMRSKPQVMIVADPSADEIAVKEARKLGVKVVGIVDTNVDPNMVDIAIPGNDDSVRSVNLLITILADAISSAKGGKQSYAYQSDDAIVLPEEPKIERPKKFGRRPGGFGNRDGQNGGTTRRFDGPRKFNKEDGKTTGAAVAKDAAAEAKAKPEVKTEGAK